MCNFDLGRRRGTTSFPYTTLFRSRVVVDAGSIVIDTANGTVRSGIFSRTNDGSSGGAGSIEVNTPGLLSMVNLGSDRKSTRLNTSHQIISYAAGCLTKTRGVWIHR